MQDNHWIFIETRLLDDVHKIIYNIRGCTQNYIVHHHSHSKYNIILANLKTRHHWIHHCVRQYLAGKHAQMKQTKKIYNVEDIDSCPHYDK